MRLATIDIGTNTILMLILECDASGKFKVLADKQVIARLGKGVDQNKIISSETFDRCEKFLLENKAIASKFKVDRIITTGTSALRDAKNRDEFIREMKQRTGLGIEIISGEEEAIWTYRGSIGGIPNVKKHSAVLDIGGGSTEMIIGSGWEVEEKKSIDIGSVRVTERFLHHSPPNHDEINQAHEFIHQQINVFPKIQSHETMFLGVAGTVTTLAALELNQQQYDSNNVAGFALSKIIIDKHYDELSTMSVEQIHSHVVVDSGRADIIFAGVMILKNILESQNVNEIIVSEKGLRFGIALREVERCGQFNH